VSTKKEVSSVPADKLALYEMLVATIPNLERKGASMPYTSLNGHMFSFLAKDGTLALRLPSGTREEFLTKYNTALCVANNVVMKEYVSVPDDLLKNTLELKEYFELGYKYISGLPPKPTKKASKIN
jgi:hypothetical protein